jgi:hypothetical protein
MVRWLSTVLLAASLLLFALAGIARADQPGPHTVSVAVLGLDSEDAEDQADALTGALRSRIRASQGWSLTETTQSLGMLTAAMKCPARPTPECQQKIADHIRTDRYLWGFVAKGPAGQVTAEVHLFQKGKPDTVVKESYADNLKDANDDTLRKIAQRMVDRLGGTTLGVVVVRAGDLNGEVVVDGEKHIPLKNGVARIELAAGGHSIEIAATGAPASKRNVLVTAGRDTVLDMPITPPPGAEQPQGKPFPTRKVVGGVVFGAGVVLGALAVQQALLYGDLKDRGKEIAKNVTAGEKPCDPNGNKEFCDTDKKTKTASALAITFASAGVVALGVGAVLLFTGGGDSAEKPPAAQKPKPRFVPQVGETTGMTVIGAF